MLPGAGDKGPDAGRPLGALLVGAQQLPLRLDAGEGVTGIMAGRVLRNGNL